MTVQRLDRVLNCYRIGDPDGRYRIYDDEGASRYPGRWNVKDVPVIYTSEHYSGAMLEKLARADRKFPPNQHFVAIIPTAR